MDLTNLSRQNKLVIFAKNNGFEVNDDGEIFRLGVKLNTNLNRSGYKTITLKLDDGGCSTRLPIHKLQAYQKYGDKLFEKGIMVRHLDGNRENNNYDNIAIGTASDNQMDIPKEIRLRSANIAWKEANPRKEDQRFEIYEMLKRGHTYKEIYERFGVAKGTLSYMKNKSKEYKDYCQNNQ